MRAICFMFSGAPRPLGMDCCPSCYRHYRSRRCPPAMAACCAHSPLISEAHISWAARRAVSSWLTAKGSHLACGQDPPGRQPHGRGGYKSQTILFQGVTTLKCPHPGPPPQLQRIPWDQLRAVLCLHWGTTVLRTRSFPSPPTDADPTGIPDLPKHIQDQLPGNSS